VREEFPEATIFMTTIIQGPPASAPVTVELFEEDLDTLNEGVDRLTESLESEGAIVTSNIGSQVRTTNYSIDYAALEEKDVSIAHVKNQLLSISECILIQYIIVDANSRESNLKYSGEHTMDELTIVNTGEGLPEKKPPADFE